MQIKPREREAIIQSLKSGVVPAIGLQHIQVGRKDEVQAIIADLERIAQGGAAIRFVIGRFGSGKSFFLTLSKLLALEKKLVVAQADITPDHRLHATGGQARALYASLMNNLSTKAKPNGGALSSIIERWIADLDQKTRSQQGEGADLSQAILEALRPLQDLVSGFDFAQVLSKYYEAYETQNEQLKNCALKWLRAEYRLKSEAKADLGVREIIEDSKIYDYLKLFAKFVSLAGFNGLLVNFDEMVVLSHRLNHAPARNNNYEMVLRILNDCLQGHVENVGFLFGGTDEFLKDPRRGLYSYEALATRLAENKFAIDGLKDFSGPVIHLASLTHEDLYVLLHNIRNVFALADTSKYLVPDEAFESFMSYCASTLGAEFYMTPRDTIKGFVGLMSILEQNPQADWKNLLGQTTLEVTQEPEYLPIDDNETDGDPLTRFTL
ncbi:MAG: ATP-binding protein [bacterium]|nr:ATP-binding protein [bacterium]